MSKQGKTSSVDAVAEFLVSRLRPALTDRSLRFQTLIAANLLDQHRRLLPLEQSLEDGERTRLSHLGADPTSGLHGARAHVATALRSGRLDDRLDETTSLLLDSTSDRLAAMNPKFDRGRGK